MGPHEWLRSRHEKKILEGEKGCPLENRTPDAVDPASVVCCLVFASREIYKKKWFYSMDGTCPRPSRETRILFSFFLVVVLVPSMEYLYLHCPTRPSELCVCRRGHLGRARRLLVIWVASQRPSNLPTLLPDPIFGLSGVLEYMERYTAWAREVLLSIESNIKARLFQIGTSVDKRT